jgi:hypothetical protein
MMIKNYTEVMENEVLLRKMLLEGRLKRRGIKKT